VKIDINVLKDYLNMKSWSLQVLALKTGLPLTTIQNYFYEKTKIPDDRLLLILSAIIPDKNDRELFIKTYNEEWYLELKEQEKFNHAIKGLTVGRHLKVLRIKRDLTLSILSKVSGITIASLSRIENDKQFPSRATFLSIINVYGLNVSDKNRSLDIYESLREIHLRNLRIEKKERGENK